MGVIGSAHLEAGHFKFSPFIMYFIQTCLNSSQRIVAAICPELCLCALHLMAADCSANVSAGARALCPLLHAAPQQVSATETISSTHRNSSNMNGW